MERGNVWFLTVTAAVIGGIVGRASFAISQNGPWIHDYQTLIAGALAVTAAFLTINEMRKTEERQQARHDREMAYYQQPEKNLIKKVKAVSSLFEKVSAECKYTSEFITQKYPEDSNTDIDIVDILRCISTCSQIALANKTSIIAEAKHLFDPTVALYHETIRMLDSMLDDVINNLNAMFKSQEMRTNNVRQIRIAADYFEVIGGMFSVFALMLDKIDQAHRPSSP